MIGIVLAGGRATRMGGGDKGERPIGGAPVLERVVATLRAQCDHVVINANGDPARFARLGCVVVPDAIGGQPGPLAGVLAGLDHAAETHPEQPFVLTVPTDTPFLPHDLVARLQDKRVADRAEIVCAASGGGAHADVHPVIALWSVALRDAIRRAVVDDGVRRVRDLLARHAVATVAWPVLPLDPFFNINSPDDLAAAERLAAGRG